MATIAVKDSLIPKLAKYGAVDKIEQCYNCGNCTAVCGLTEENGEFPRKLIRYAQLGLKSKLIGSDYIWQCYQCGQCTETCPRDADPAAFMMATRKYLIANNDFSQISRIMNISNAVFLLFTIGIAAVVSGVLAFVANEIPTTDEVAYFDYIPFEFIHNIGIIMGGVFALFILIGIVIMTSNSLRVSSKSKGSLFSWIYGFFHTLIVEVMFLNSFRKECEEESPKWYENRWLLHMAILWGFGGLFLATALDFLLKEPGSFVPIWYPPRLIGTIAGILFVLGTGLSIINRFRRKTAYTKSTTLEDWVILWVLFIAGITGFIIEIAIYAPITAPWIYYTFFVHLVFSAELLILIPFTKLGHVIYRPVGLWIQKSVS